MLVPCVLMDWRNKLFKIWDTSPSSVQFALTSARVTLERIKESHPEVYPNWINFRFPGRGQRETPIADVRGIVEIVMLLPGRHAARVRRQAAELLCRAC